MTMEDKLAKLTQANRKLEEAYIAIHDAGVLHDDAMSISTNRFHKLRLDVDSIRSLVDACQSSLRKEPSEALNFEGSPDA